MTESTTVALDDEPDTGPLSKRTIRRHQLREIVPLADTTIYGMGATRRVSAALLPDLSNRRVGSQRSGGLAWRAPPSPHFSSLSISACLPLCCTWQSRRTRRCVRH